MFSGLKNNACFSMSQVIAVIGPMLIIVGIYMKRRNVYDLHHAILGKFPALTLAFCSEPIMTSVVQCV